jgi:hypothetical protein
MRISKHLTLLELTKSDTAIRMKIDNNPTPEHLENLKRVANNVFEPLREHFGVPIAISSGYRSEALNTAVKGSTTSQHCKGEAIDMSAGSREENKKLFDWCKANLIFDQLLNEYDYSWVHISYKLGMNRNQTLTINETDF